MRRWWTVLLACMAAAVVVAEDFAPVADEASRVVIVANRNDAESVELARFYADRREIPRANIVQLDLPAGETINWHQFVERLYTPLQQWLMAEGWVESIAMDLIDDVGRRKVSPAGHRISYLVLCRGVPLKIKQTGDVPKDGPANISSGFATHRASVDSELALINQSAPQRDGFVRNPLFGEEDPGLFTPDEVVRVARLDGPTFIAVRNMVDSALRVEREGLIGRAFVDIGGPHKRGDGWFGEVEELLTEAGWHPQVHRTKGTLPATGRADGLAIYMGWYAGSINGPFADLGYQFAPGAIALHLHSFSAGTLRLREGNGWTGPFVARGAAATVGNVYEPYLEFTHHPHLLMRALLAGATLGEAAYYAMPALSWQSVVVGDPLYRPFAVSREEQLAQIDILPHRWASYLLASQITVPAEEEITDEHLSAARKAFNQAPSLALAWEIAQLKDRAGNRAGAVAQLKLAEYLKRVRVSERGLVAAIAQQLTAWEEPAGALKVWQVLLAQELPDKLREAWLPLASAAAKEAGEFQQMIEWDRRLRELKSAPPANGRQGG